MNRLVAFFTARRRRRERERLEGLEAEARRTVFTLARDHCAAVGPAAVAEEYDVTGWSLDNIAARYAEQAFQPASRTEAQRGAKTGFLDWLETHPHRNRIIPPTSC